MRGFVSRKSALCMGLVLLFASTTAVLLYHFYPQLIYEFDSVSNLWGQYSVRTYRRYEGDGMYWEAVFGRRPIFRFTGVTAYCEVLYGWRRVFSRSGRQAFYVELLGTDVTGNGKPDLVLRQWLGSAHGDSRYLVCELDGPNVREIAVIDGLLGVAWDDVNGDGIPEVTGRDWAHRYFMGGSNAGSPRPMVVLSYDRERAGFRLDREAMSRRPLSESEFSRLSVKYKEDIRGHEGRRPPTEFVDTLFDLIYSGNGEQAWRLLEASWPEGARGDKEELRRSIEGSLIRSRFCAAIADWNKERR